MNILTLEHGKLAGLDMDLKAPPAARYLGIRPEDIHFDGAVPTTIKSTEFTGADLLMHSQIGGQNLTVRAPGKSIVKLDAHLNLGWHTSDQHWFDADGLRIHTSTENLS